MGVCSFFLLLSSLVSGRRRVERRRIHQGVRVTMDSLTRFSSRVENYAKYRPGYPAEVVSILKSKCGLTGESTIADVGSGTGILSEVFLRNGNTVFAIEPNIPMRLFAEQT